MQKEILAALDRWDFAKLGTEEQRWYLRILTISASRHGRFDDATAAKLLSQVELAFPSSDRSVNEETVSLWAALRNKTLIEPT